MKALVKNLLQAVVVLLLTFAIVLGLIWVLDDALDGIFADWFHWKFMVLPYPPYIDWPAFKKFVLETMVIALMLLVLAAFVAAKLYARRRVRRVLGQVSQLVHTYMRADMDAGEVFPGEFALVSAQMADIKNAMLKSEQTLRDEATRRNDLVMYLAHDIRTPLTSVIGYLSLLAEAPEMPVQQRAKYVDITLDKALRLERMVNEFFEITRYNMQNISITKSRVDLCYLLLQLTDELSPLLAERGNVARLVCDEELVVWGDADQLARVFNNVLKNAAAYSSPDTEISINARQQDGWVELRFQNQGREIPKEKLAAIFEKFYRLDDARGSNTGGAGLGLAIAKEIVNLHGGSILAESEGGTVCFIIRLPQPEL